MSELKATTIYDAYWKANSTGEGTGTLVYLKSEADKVIAELKARIAELEEERRWRKFSDEKPTEEMEGMDFIVSNGFFHREISEWRGCWNNDPFCGDRHCDEVKYWRPLPLEPKEEIDELKESIDEFQKAADSAWSKVNAMYDELRHHKYKRCLAMEKEWRSYAAFCGIQSSWHNNRGFGKTAEKYSWKECHAWRCVKRWLELAEKFKSNNSTAQ